MVPPQTHQAWVKLVTGSLDHNFACVPAGMMFARMRREFVRKSDQKLVPGFVAEAHTFFNKYEKLLQPDIAVIFGGVR